MISQRESEISEFRHLRFSEEKGTVQEIRKKKNRKLEVSSAAQRYSRAKSGNEARPLFPRRKARRKCEPKKQNKSERLYKSKRERGLLRNPSEALKCAINCELIDPTDRVTSSRKFATDPFRSFGRRSARERSRLLSVKIDF